MQHKILILDDHPLVRSGIRVSLEETFPDCEVWEASTVAEAISITAEQSPTVAVIDLRLQDESGLQYAEYVSREEKDIPCVVLTSFSSPQSILAAFDTGAVNAFLEKSLDIEPLAAAIDAASKGFSSLTLSVAREAARNIQSEGGYNPAEFTERENAIAQLVADGHSDTAIAEELNIASSTIRNHLTSIYRKLDVESRTQLASRVWRQRASSPGHTPSNEN